MGAPLIHGGGISIEHSFAPQRANRRISDAREGKVPALERLVEFVGDGEIGVHVKQSYAARAMSKPDSIQMFMNRGRR